MANDSYLGILKQFGLELPNEQFTRQAAREARIKQALSMGGISEEAATSPLTGTFGRLGATVGGVLARKSNPAANPEMPPELQQRYDLVNKAKTDFQNYRVDHPDATEDELEDAYQKILIKSAYSVGLPDIGTTMLGSFRQQRIAKEAAQKELEKLGYETTVAKADVELLPDVQAHKKWKIATEKDADLYDLEGNALGRWRIDDKGNATDANGKVMFRLGEYTTDDGGGGGGGGGGDSLPITKSRVAQLQNMQLGARDMIFVSNKLADVMDAATRRDPKGQVLGWGGDVARTVTNVADNVTGAMATIGKLFDVEGNAVEIVIPGPPGPDGKPRAVDARTGQSQLVKEFEGEITETLASLPNSFRELGLDANRAKTTLMSLAYAIMRAEEPGNSRYSDDDYRRALKLAGEGLADPNKLKATLFDKLAQYHNQYIISREQIDPKYHKEIWAEASHTNYMKEYDAFMKRFAPKSGATTGTAQGPAGWRVVKRPGE